ncbi:hypothetical protein OLX02_10720 [Novosphingobium sp. KCTC 2891]|uniref:hypothetical protein n=1 Tax=Novosphingobium sp. KCTC 2891 TaxID=2989730 RepID=UPI002223A79C|nr:hypothetical protein [Novosphingobium sp. KCTC 2891]MCW1383296.1 hypothetical protein [Novosphingobium sp. KCTC 2891]
MARSRDALLLEAGLERAAEQLGDITPQAMALLESRHPGAAAQFAALAADGRAEALTGMMVEQTLYCIMQWLESRSEIEIILWGSVPHHAETLGIDPILFAGLFAATCDVITAAMTDADELALWARLKTDLVGLTERVAETIRAPV